MVDAQITNLWAVTSDQILNKNVKGLGKINESRHFQANEVLQVDIIRSGGLFRPFSKSTKACESHHQLVFASPDVCHTPWYSIFIYKYGGGNK